MADSVVVLRMSNESIVGMTGKPGFFKDIKALKPMELPCARMHTQLKNIGCAGCGGKKKKEAIQATFKRVTTALYQLMLKADKEDRRHFQQFVSNASGKWVIGLELEIQIDGKPAKLMF